MAEEDRPLSELVAGLPAYAMLKTKFELPREKLPAAFAALRAEWPTAECGHPRRPAAGRPGLVAARPRQQHRTRGAGDRRGAEPPTSPDGSVMRRVESFAAVSREAAAERGSYTHVRRPESAADLLRSAGRVCVLSGAGVSAESGVPTFRASDGLWEGHRIEDVAHPDGWAKNPQRVWDFYHARRATAGSVSPNPGHVALAASSNSGSATASPWPRRTWTACTSGRAARTCWNCTAACGGPAAPAASTVTDQGLDPLPPMPTCVSVRGGDCGRTSSGSARTSTPESSARPGESAAELRRVPGGRHVGGGVPGRRAGVARGRSAGLR